MSNLPTWFAGLIVLAGSISAATFGVGIFRRSRWYSSLQGHSDFVNHVYAVIGLIYGVFLAFTIIIAWQQYSDAERTATNEASEISILWRDAQIFPESVRSTIQDNLLVYTRNVLLTEWNSMAQEGWKSGEASIAYEKIWQSYYDFRPLSDIEKSFYNESLSQLNNFGIQRRLRLMYSRSQLPPILWIFLIAGGMVTTMFPCLFWTGNPKLQRMVIALLTGLISSSLFVTLSLQHPFTGEVSIKPTAFRLLIQSLEERRQSQTTSEKQAIERKP